METVKITGYAFGPPPPSRMRKGENLYFYTEAKFGALDPAPSPRQWAAFRRGSWVHYGGDRWIRCGTVHPAEAEFIR